MYRGSKEQRHGHISWAQHGDDMMIANLFDLIGVRCGTYLDLGAHKPEEISNTALLYNLGWAGVNVEANPNLISDFNRFRPNDTNLNKGVAAEPGRMKMFMDSPEGGRSTLSEKARDQLVAEGHNVTSIEVEVTTVNDIVRFYMSCRWPDFVNMDLEELDYEVLQSIEWPPMEHAPKVWCIEIRKDDHLRFRELMHLAGYFVICRMGENLIFVRKDFEELVR